MIKTTLERWVNKKLKAQSDIVFTINTSEIKQIKSCNTSKDILREVEINTILVKKPSKESSPITLTNISIKMQEEKDPQKYTRNYFYDVIKLAKMNVDIIKDLPELISVMLLKILPENFENFLCTISSTNDWMSPRIDSSRSRNEIYMRREIRY